MQNEAVDLKYYQAAKPHSLAERLTIIARDAMYDDFLAICRPTATTTVLDLGISDVLNDAANALERKYPYLHQVTAVGLGEASRFRATYPEVRYRQIEPGDALPFPDKSFDIATSNAVLEHVGSREAQAFFLDEMFRVARVVFVTVPNRFFPIEHHTAIPLLHFWDKPFSLACRLLGKEEWADKRNLILMERDALAKLAPRGQRVMVAYSGIRLGPFSSNLILHSETVE
ncbi:Class I SAM-dependent methyltransferase [Hyphomicrobiales bacterium]|nr:Class I SAM-dependent methyltransferase [Hyphomicrobiales bacterium]CAH1674409.1 Class I SAM-dependent methyltransferase [Hyphomicrobiales bacterium]